MAISVYLNTKGRSSGVILSKIGWWCLTSIFGLHSAGLRVFMYGRAFSFGNAVWFVSQEELHGGHKWHIFLKYNCCILPVKILFIHLSIHM
jgi:hypothetical protein